MSEEEELNLQTFDDVEASESEPLKQFYLYFKDFITMVKDLMNDEKDFDLEFYIENDLKPLLENKPQMIHNVLGVFDIFIKIRFSRAYLMLELFPIILDLFPEKQQHIHDYVKKNFAHSLYELVKDLFSSSIIKGSQPSKELSIENLMNYPENSLNYILIHDNLDGLQEKALEPNFDYSQHITFNSASFNLFPFENPTLLEFCAFNCSIQCAKYLILNQCEITSRVCKYAIYGGNLELIRYLQTQNYIYDSYLLLESIKYHRYDISNWILTNNYVRSISLEKCLINYNYLAFLFFFFSTKEPYMDLTLLKLACKQGFLPLIKYYFSSDNISIEEKENAKEELILIACEEDHLEILEYLFIEQKDIQISNFQNDVKPLYLACKNDSLKTLQFLINQGYNKESKIYNGNTPFMEASFYNSLSIAKYLNETLKVNTDSRNSSIENALHLACLTTNNSVLSYLCTIENIDKNLQNRLGATPLHYIARTGDLEACKALIETAKANMEIKDLEGMTPLLIAVKLSRTDIIEYLIQKGANTDATNNKGQNALHIAAGCEQIPIIREILQLTKLNLETKDQLGLTPLLFAVLNNYYPVVKFLIESGANVKATDNNGDTALHIACANGWKELAEYFLKNNLIDINVQNNNGLTPLHYACKSKHNHIIVLLNEYNVDIDLPDSSGKTALHYCCAASYLENIKYLVEECIADIEAVDMSGSTPLISACQSIKYNSFFPNFISFNIIEYLVEHGCDTSATLLNGRNAFIIACSKGDLTIVKYLKDHTSDDDIYAKDILGMNALDVAAEKHCVNIMNYLIEELGFDPNQLL